MAENFEQKSPRRKRGQKLSSQVYEEIIHFIADSDLAVGDRLPTEARYCELFSVSRTVVREALERLKIDGIVESRQGRGSAVLKRPNRDVFSLAAVGSIAELQMFFEFRQIVEGETAALAALRRSGEDLVRLGNAYDAINASFDKEEKAVNEDLTFHLAVADAAHNKFFQATIQASRGEFIKGMSFARELTVRYTKERGKIMQAEHLRVLEAIRASDPDGARTAMVAHLAETRNRVFTGDHSD